MKFLEATNDLMYKAAFMDKFFHERFKIIEASQSNFVEVPAFPPAMMPPTLFDNSIELRDNPSCFSNCSYREFFGKTIVTEKPKYAGARCGQNDCEAIKKNIATIHHNQQ